MNFKRYRADDLDFDICCQNHDPEELTSRLFQLMLIFPLKVINKNVNYSL